MMTQLKFYKYATIGLLVLNLAMVAFFFLTKPDSNHRSPVGNRGDAVVDILKLDEKQDASFLQLAEQHILLMDDFDAQQRNLLQTYFNRLVDRNEVDHADSLLTHVQLLERKKIESTYQHFQDVKAMLRPEQQADFAVFMDHALSRILLTQRNQPPPPRGR